MNLAKFSVNNSLAVNLFSALLLIAGVLIVFQIPREAFPNVDFGRVTVTTYFPGSTPNEVEKHIAIPIEDELRDVDGIEDVTSISLESLSMIMIKLDINAKDQTKIVNDIQRAVDRASGLPDNAEDPIVKEINTQDEPIIIVSLSGDDIWTVRQLAKDLEDLLEEVSGVARVDKLGWKKTEIWVEIDPKKLVDYHLSFDTIANSLRKRNTNLPGGKVYINGEQHVVRTIGEFETPEEIERVIIRANDAGNWLTIKEVAHVGYALEDSDRIDKTNGKAAVNLMVVKKQRADTLRLVEKLYREIDEFKLGMPANTYLTTIEDLSLKYVRRRLKILTNNGSIGILFLTIILFIFLGWRMALLTSLGIPLSFCITVLFMWQIGITINLIAMFGLIMVLGMLVDDAIVIAENCYRYIERGLSPAEAAIRGTAEVIRPVTATILTTVVFFGSLFFLTGIMGKFIWVIPAVVIISLLASLFESIVILPSHIADFAVSKRIGAKLTSSRIESAAWFIRMRAAYLRILKQALRIRWRVFFIAIGVTIASIVFAVKTMKIVLFPHRGVETFFVRTEASAGTSIEELEELMRPIEAAIANLPQHELDNFLTTVGLQQQDASDPYQRRGTNIGQIQVYLTTSSGRKREASEIMDELREKIGKIDAVDVTFEAMRPGPPVGKAIEVTIRGDEFDVLESIAEEFKSFLGGVAGVKDIRDNYEPGKPEFRVVVNPQAARRARVGIADVGRAVRFAYEGIPATSIKRTDEEIDVVVRFPKESRHDLSTLQNILIENDRGDLVPLNQIATFETEPGISFVTHLDFKRSITITATVDEDVVTSFEVNHQLVKKFEDLPQRNPGYSARFGGEQEETMESFQNFFKAFIISILACYCILAITFNSLLHPFVVMLAIPFGLIGVICAFFVHGFPLSFMTLLGTIGLSGVVLNDSIVLVTFIIEQRRKGRSMNRSILSAGKLRFRPVLLTTISTAVGIAPVAYGIGGLDPFLQPAALAIAWGIVFATALTLIVIPCLYAMELDIREWFKRRKVKTI